MRRNRGICLFCRHTLSLRSSPRAAKRFASDSQREPYVLPRLVIDLDAADSKYVRQAEEDELKEWRPESPKNPQTSPRSTPDWKQVRILRRDPRGLSTIQVTPPDLLTFALLGDPSRGWGPKTQYLRSIYRYLQLDLEDGVDARAIQLTSEFTHNAKERLSRAGFAEDKRRKAYMSGQLGDFYDRGGYPHVARMISMLSTTKEGCSFLATRGNIIRRAIKCSRKAQNQDNRQTIVTSEMVVLLLNNLRLSMESKGIYLNYEIAGMALHYAAKSWNLPAIRTYLEISSGDPFRITSPAHILCSLVSRLLNEPEKAAGSTRQATLELITGLDGSKNPVVSGHRDLSLASLFATQASNSFSLAYLVGLAELGLKDTLQAEWEADSRNAIKSEFWEANTKLKAQSFAAAFLLAGDRDRAFSILQSIAQDQTEDEDTLSDSLHYSPPPLEQEELVTEEAVDETDEAADGAIEKKPSRFRALFPFFEKHYFLHHVRSSDSLVKALEHALDHLSNDPAQILSTFEMFLIRDYRAPPTQDFASFKHLQWFSEGVEGLVVMPEEGDTPLYWKLARAEAETSVQADA
ncbi:hypothetical protein BDZ45DRAFT_742832 [Acephala macrosclerotiorum]|nr:hypothetical protein BDZ45DRAFT_742832 [Acephala macrosclerotiorum]